MFLALLQTMRPKQWAKNGLLFAALIFDGQLFYPPAVLRTLAGFVLFSLLSSVVYILNDLTDLEADRQHPIKRLRPLPSGRLPVGVARVAAVVILLVVLPLAYLLSVPFAVIAVVYLLVNIAYSAKLKHIPILDVLVLASLYVLRVGAGVELIDVTLFPLVPDALPRWPALALLGAFGLCHVALSSLAVWRMLEPDERARLQPLFRRVKRSPARES